MTAKLVAESSSPEVLRGKVTGLKQLPSRKTYPRFLALESEADGQQSALVSKVLVTDFFSMADRVVGIKCEALVGKRGFTINTDLPLNFPGALYIQ